MRYKSYTYISLLILSALLLWLYIEQSITRYIHPRYVLFTVSMSLIALIVLLLTFKQASSANTNRRSLILFALIIALLPAFTLSERTASSRLQQNYTQIKSEQLSFDAFSQDYSHFDIADWLSLLSSTSDVNDIVGKKANLQGFVFTDQSNQRYIARFKLSCCAVDATPLTIPLLNSETTSQLVDGAWYEVEGAFVETKDTSHTFQLDLTKSTQIEEPADPYVF